MSKEREYTPDDITELKPNEIFVFGSNSQGVHGKGAALTAKQKFGAIQGKASGLQGQSYGIVTKSHWTRKRSISLDDIRAQLAFLCGFALMTPDRKFLVTKLGSSNAGYSINEIRKIFEEIKHMLPDNMILPKEYEIRH